jgi:FHIPEP family protein
MSASAAVRVELHPALWGCVESRGAAEIETRTAQRVGRSLAALGVLERPELAICPGSSARAVRVIVDGVEQPFPPSFLTRLWFAVAPRDLRELAFDPGRQRGDGGQAWLVEVAASLQALECDDARRTISDLVEHLTAEVLSLHPDCVLGDEGSVAHLAGGGAKLPDGVPIALRLLLQHGVAISDEGKIVELMSGATALDRNPEDAAEEVLAALRGPAIEIHVDHATFGALLNADVNDERISLDDPRLSTTLAEAMGFVIDLQLRRFGVDVPVVLVGAPACEGSEIQIKINDRLGPPVPLPAPGELGVSATPATLEHAGIRSRGLVDPVAGTHLSAVGERDVDAVFAAGHVPVPPAAYLAASFGRTLVALGYRLITVDRVEAMLARFEEELPVVVHATLARYSLGELTRLLRAMAREGVAIDDLWRILNALVIFAEVERPELESNRLEAVTTRVRLELGDRITVDSCGLAAIGAGEAAVFETDRGFEERIEHWLESPPADTEVRAARQAVWDSFVAAGSPGEPVILTSPRVRATLRAALDHEFPEVCVLSREEIPSGVPVRQLGQIADVR